MSLLTLSSFSRRRTPVLSSSGRALLAFVLAPFDRGSIAIPVALSVPICLQEYGTSGSYATRECKPG